MALATADDVEARLGRPLTGAEESRADALLAEASALVIGHLGVDPTDTSVTPPTVPDAAVIVTSRMVARVLAQTADGQVPVGVTQMVDRIGDLGQTLSFRAGANEGGPWLTKSDRIMLRSLQAGGGMTSLPMSSGRTGRYRRLL